MVRHVPPKLSGKRGGFGPRRKGTQPTHTAGHGPDYDAPGRNLALELVRVTEAAALAAAPWLGRGDKEAADGAAVNAMRAVFGSISFDGEVAIGEGEKDEAPMLYNGESLGDGLQPRVDVCVDPVDGTTLVSKGLPGAVAVVGAAPRGAMYRPRCFYMSKLVVGPEVAPQEVDVRGPISANIDVVAARRNIPVSEVCVAVLDRPRHDGLIDRIRRHGARVKLIPDGDVAAAIAVTQLESGVDMLAGVGGAPEAVIAACALRGLGGTMQAVPWDHEGGSASLSEEGLPGGEAPLFTEDLCGGDDVFFAATAVSDVGGFLRGVRFIPGGATSSSMVVRSRSRTVRKIETTHRWSLGHSPNLLTEH